MAGYLIYLQLLKPFVDSLANLYELVLKSKVGRNNDAAEYFENLASAMTLVLEGLRARQVPRIAGNEMDTLIHYGFPKRTKGVLDATDSAAVKLALDQASEIAKTLDKQIFYEQPSNERDRDQMLAQIERVVGTCTGLAKVLRRGS